MKNRFRLGRCNDLGGYRSSALPWEWSEFAPPGCQVGRFIKLPLDCRHDRLTEVNTKMVTLKETIRPHLAKHGRSTVSDIANRTGYSPGHVRTTCRSMMNEGTIEGEKVPRRIPAVIVNGKFHVLSGAKDDLLRIIREHAPHRISDAEAMTVQQLRNFIADELADRTLSINRPVWEFWV